MGSMPTVNSLESHVLQAEFDHRIGQGASGENLVGDGFGLPLGSRYFRISLQRGLYQLVQGKRILL